jgi:hypothetical protein
LAYLEAELVWVEAFNFAQDDKAEREEEEGLRWISLRGFCGGTSEMQGFLDFARNDEYGWRRSE